MKLAIGKHIGQVEVVPGLIKEYRQDPSDRNAAVHAAGHYAKKQKRRMVVIGGNSYGRPTYHIASETDDLLKYTVMKVRTAVYVVDPEGNVSHAIAEPSWPDPVRFEKLTEKERQEMYTKKAVSTWVPEVDHEVRGYSKETPAFAGMVKWIRKLDNSGLLTDAQLDHRLWSSLEFALEGEDSTLLYNVLTKLDAQGFLDDVWDSRYENTVRRALLQLEKEVRGMSRNASLRRAMVHLAYQQAHRVATSRLTWLGLSNDYLGLLPSARDAGNKKQILIVGTLASKLSSLERIAVESRGLVENVLVNLDDYDEGAKPDAVRRWEKAVKSYRRGVDSLVKEANKCAAMLKSEGLGVADWGEELAHRVTLMKQDTLAFLREQEDFG
jgi:hypothetical protein